MSSIKKIGSLEIEKEAEKVSWHFIYFQRIGVMVMFVIVVTGFLGLFGHGLFGQITQSQGRLTVNYDRFARLQSANSLSVEIQPAQTSAFVSVAFNNSILKISSIKSINPSPVIQTISETKINYTFSITPKTSRIRIIFMIEPETFGWRHGYVSLENGDQVYLAQLIYP